MKVFTSIGEKVPPRADKRSFIKIRNGKGVGKWVLLYVTNGYDYDMCEALPEDNPYGEEYVFGKEVVAVFNTREGALQYFQDEKLYEKAYKDILKANYFDDVFEDDEDEDGEDRPLDRIRQNLGDCAGNRDNWKDFYYELVPAKSVEK